MMGSLGGEGHRGHEESSQVMRGGHRGHEEVTGVMRRSQGS